MKNIVFICVCGLLFGCGNGGGSLSDFKLGADFYPPVPACKLLYSKDKPVDGIYLKQITKSNGKLLEGVGCDSENVIVDLDSVPATWKYGKL